MFEIENFDGRESPDLIDGMAVDDVWGWLLPEGVTEKDDDHFGCVEWRLNNGKLELSWHIWYSYYLKSDKSTYCASESEKR